MNIRLYYALIFSIFIHSLFIHGRGIIQVRPIEIDDPRNILVQEPFSITVPKKHLLPLLTPLMKSSGKFPFRYALSGYVKHEAFYDSVQVNAEVQDHLLYFPLKPFGDRCGRDINDKGHFNMLTIETRLRLELAGPRIFNANTYAAIEADMWSDCALQVGLVRERNAFMYFDWEKKNLLLGLYWHPLFIPECYPQTVSFNTGAPIEPFAREPQVRITKHFDNMAVIFAALARTSSTVDGPVIPDDLVVIDSLDTSLYTRWGILPTLDLQVQATIGNNLFGLGVDVTRYVPRLVTDLNYKVTESFFSFIAMGFATLDWPTFAVRMKALYAQNGQGYGLISGYSVACMDPLTDERTYANLQCVGGWIDMNYKGKVEPGLLIGFSQNIGATQTIIPYATNPATGNAITTVYNSVNTFNNQDLAYVLRFSPRVKWNNLPFVFGAEIELTTAGWGKITTSGNIIDTKNTNNLRALFATYYIF
jgi:hypothetical protein